MNPSTYRTMIRRSFHMACLGLAVAVTAPAWSQAAPGEEAPDALIRRVSTDVIETVKGDKAIQAGDIGRIIALVDSKIMPHVNFQRMTASAVGPAWRQATPEQRNRLQSEFKTLLVRTYSGALTQVKDQTIALRPMRASPGDTEVTVRTEVRGRGEPIQLDYRMEKGEGGWKVYDLNVLGVWMVETYKGQFAQQINAKGIDGLIESLGSRNKANAERKS